MTKVFLTIVIPAFNEGEGIAQTLQCLCEHESLAGAEIIVVDDGSLDDTAAQVKRFPNVRLISHHVNRGYGSALVTGTRKSKGDIVVWFDADGQHRVKDLLAIFKRIAENDLDYCIGVRNSSSYQVSCRRFGKLVLKRVVRFAAGQKVGDFNSGLRGFKRDIIKRYLHLLPKGFGASTTTTLLLLEQFHRGEEIPITVMERIGKSSVRQVRDGLRTLLLILRIFLLFKPLHFFGGIGLVSGLMGLSYGFWISLSEGMGFPVLGAVAFLFGIQVIFLGLVMDQISGIRRERFE